MNALEIGAYQQRTMGHDSTWLHMNSAPRDGTWVELKNTYGIAPWYCVARWTDEDVALSANGMVPFRASKKSWIKQGGGGPFSETSLQWRPYAGTVDNYIDPTGGLQNDMAYWRGAVAAKYCLPLDSFEKEAAANQKKNNYQNAKPRQSFFDWLFSGRKK